SVQMSSPAVSWSRRKADTASVYCSRKAELTIASMKVRRPRFSVYHAGRGNDPVTVVGMVSPAVALYIEASPYLLWRHRSDHAGNETAPTRPPPFAKSDLRSIAKPGCRPCSRTSPPAAPGP